MFKKAVTFIILSFIFLPTIYAEGSFKVGIDEFMDNLSSTVTASKNGKILADIPLKSDGMIFSIYRYGDDIIHPITGENLGRRKVDLGNAIIKNHGDIIYLGKDNLTAGDKIVIAKPLPIKLKFDSKLSAMTISNIRVQIDRSSYFKITDDNASYLLECAGLNIKEAECSLIYDKTTILKSKINQTYFALEDILSKKILKDNDTMISDNLLKIDRDVTSVATGYVYGRDKLPNVLLSDGTTIYIYSLDGKELTEVFMLSDDFDNILSIELLDLNSDGRDEIFITNIKEKAENKVNSMIYEYDGKKFVKVKDEIPLIFRTYFSLGKKHLIVQSFYGLEYSGKISYYGYADKEYKIISDIDNSLGYRVYGFGVSSASELISITLSGSLDIMHGLSKFESVSKVFADNNKYLFYNKDRIIGQKTGMNGNKTDMVESSTIAIPILQRIIEPKNNMFLLAVNNTLGSTQDQINLFTSATLGIYSMIDDRLDSLYKINYSEPSIIESDILNIGGSDYIVTLFNINKNRYKTSIKSQLKIFKII